MSDKVKVKPNERCPCGSGIKYKKCCSVAEQQAKIDLLMNFSEMLLANEKGSIKTDRLRVLNSYFLDRYGVPSVDISDIVDNLNLNKIHNHYMGKNIILMCERNESNNLAFTCKGGKLLDNPDHENIMIIHKNKFLQFRHETEREDALKEIDVWLSNKKSAGRDQGQGRTLVK